MTTRMMAIAAAVGFLAAAPAAQAHHYYGHRCYYSHHCHYGYVPHHHGCYYGHANWCHVVPHCHHYHGCYYTVGRCHYYTSSAIVNLGPGTADKAGVVKLDGGIQPEKPVELTFGGFTRSDDLAARLAAEANALCLDLHYNYAGNAQFADVYADAYAVLEAAKSLQGKDRTLDQKTATQRMMEAEKVFQRVLDAMTAWKRTEAKTIGTGGLSEKVAGVEAVLNHLCFDVGVKVLEKADDLSSRLDPNSELTAPTGKAEPATTTDLLTASKATSLTEAKPAIPTLPDPSTEAAPVPAKRKK